MILKSLRIENYRSIRDVTLGCDNLTILVGANGSGKSSFLRAIDLFQAEKPDLTEEDYYGRQTENDIKITATLKNLSDSAKTQFKDYALGDEITVTRIFEWDNGKVRTTYYGTRLQNPDFAFIHNDSAKIAKQKYEDFRKKDDYKDLPEWTTHPNTKAMLREWEKNNPARCRVALDDGKFFKHSQGFPKRFVQFLYITPVHDAAEDAEEGRNSVLAELMGLVVKSSLAERKGVKKFKESAQKRYRELMLSCERRELKKLGVRMSKTVKQFAPSAEVGLSWNSTELTIEPPAASVNLVEDDYRSAVSRAGHGLQRVFIMSILQHLSEAQSGDDGTDEFPALILAIDEPELYQHPNRQRHMSQVLLALANKSISGASRDTQVIYSTHSPNFIGIDRLDQIRLVQKIEDRPSGLRKTCISRTSLKEVADALTATPGHGTETEDDLKRRLHTIMTPAMTEGFFADVVVLVEGPGDDAALAAVAKALGYPLDGLGISIIPCNGKDNLGRPAMIFRLLGIPLYVVWDGDFANQGSNWNRVLLAVLGEEPQGSPAGIHDTFACLDSKLEEVVEKDLGTKFESYLDICAKDLNLSRRDSRKKPHAISYTIKIATRDKIQFPTLKSVVQRVIRRHLGGAFTCRHSRGQR